MIRIPSDNNPATLEELSRTFGRMGRNTKELQDVLERWEPSIALGILHKQAAQTLTQIFKDEGKTLIEEWNNSDAKERLRLMQRVSKKIFKAYEMRPTPVIGSKDKDAWAYFCKGSNTQQTHKFPAHIGLGMLTALSNIPLRQQFSPERFKAETKRNPLIQHEHPLPYILTQLLHECAHAHAQHLATQENPRRDLDYNIPFIAPKPDKEAIIRTFPNWHDISPSERNARIPEELAAQSIGALL